MKNLLVGALALSVVVAIPCYANANPALDFILSSSQQDMPTRTNDTRKGETPRLLAEARRSLGQGHRALGVGGSLWCAEAVNVWLSRSGLKPVDSRLARDMIKAGTRVSAPQPGAIAIFRRGRAGGHVAVVDQVEAGGYTAVSPNYGGRVALAHYRNGSAIAFVIPRSRG